MGWKHGPLGDVFVVCDGMGGYRGGAAAAELAVSTLQDRIASESPTAKEFPEKLRQAFQAANAAVYAKRRPEDPETRDMGSTGVVLVTSGSRFIVAHVGDSRAYLWGPLTGLRRLTRDHTRVQGMIDQGLLSEKQARSHPDASLLTRAIGHNPTVEAEVSSWRQLYYGDLLLLCSDGLSGYVSDREIARILRSQSDPRGLAKALIQKALKKGGEDNVTVQLIRYAPRHAGRVLLSAMFGCVVGLGVGTFGIMALQHKEQHASATTGSIPGAEARLRSDLDGLQGKVSGIAGQITTMQSDIGGLKDQVAAIRPQQSAARPDPVASTSLSAPGSRSTPAGAAGKGVKDPNASKKSTAAAHTKSSATDTTTHSHKPPAKPTENTNSSNQTTTPVGDSHVASRSGAIANSTQPAVTNSPAATVPQ